MTSTFLRHRLTKAQLLWIAESEKLNGYDPRILKKRLYGKITRDFGAWRIDNRIWNRGELTLAGIRLLRPSDPLLKDVDSVIRAIRQRIMDDEGIRVITSEGIEPIAALDGKRVRHCFYRIIQLGGFGEAGTRIEGELNAYASILISGDDDYDGYPP